MNIAILALLLLLTSPPQEADQLRGCVEEDICSTIIFNQLAIASLQEEVGALVTDIKGIAKAFNTTKMEYKTAVDTAALDQCLQRSSQLQEEVRSLEGKYGELKSKDQRQNEESENLKGEVGTLRKVKEELEEEKQRNNEEILQLRENMRNLTLRLEFFQSLARPVDCADIQKQGHRNSGVYAIYPIMFKDPIEVFCDLESDGGGWTVFLSRQPQEQPLDFNESWENFKKGFGDVNKEYWLGNDVIHALSSSKGSTLRVDAEVFDGEGRWGAWHLFSVGDADNKYQLTIGSFNATSTLGDSLSFVNGTRFTTFDADNDESRDYNCAISVSGLTWGQGGWWYKECGLARPTAPIINTNNWDSCSWQNWDPSGTNLVSFRTLSMKLRRHS